MKDLYYYLKEVIITTLLLILIVVVFIGIPGTIFYGYHKAIIYYEIESQYDFCQNVKVPEAKIGVFKMGELESNGEICIVESVEALTYVANRESCSHYNVNGPETVTIDKVNKCQTIIKECRKPIVRRIVCPSGKNGESKVDKVESKAGKMRINMEILE